MPSDYKVRIEVFEGPLDLLLYLIKKEEVDIYAVSIERITRQYLEYLDTFRMLDLEIAGEFVVMAATLIYIKSCSLLPVHQQPREETRTPERGRAKKWLPDVSVGTAYYRHEGGIQDFTGQLIHSSYGSVLAGLELRGKLDLKDAAFQLHQRELLQEGVIPRVPEKPQFDERETILQSEVGIFDLISAFQKVLKKLEDRREDLREIFEENFTVSDKIDFIIRTTSANRRIAFSELFVSAASRTEIVVTFLALLELIRLKQLRVMQEAPFSEIDIERISV